MKSLLFVTLILGVALTQTTFDINLDDPTAVLNLVDLEVGDLVNIDVSENPTTGFIWIYNLPKSNSNAIYEIVSDRYVRPQGENSQDPAIGSQGVRKIGIKVTKVGDFNFELALARPWMF